MPKPRSLEAPVSKLAVFTSLFALIVMTGISPDWSLAQSPYQRSTLNNGKMSIEVGAKIFDRPGDDNSDALVFDSVTNANLLSSDRATDLGSNFGVDISITKPGLYDRSLQFRTVLVEWDEENLIIGDNALSSSFFADELNPPQGFAYNTESDFYSFELMQRRAVWPGMTVSAGPRFISTSDTTATTGLFMDGSAPEFNTFDAKNSLIGLQVGLEYNQPVAQSVFLTVFGRAGGYYNGTKFDTTSTTADPAFAVTRRTRSTESFVADAGGRVNFVIVPNCISSFIGYEATVLDGIALSSENIFNPGRIDTNNTVFFQAITFGANFNF